jgi:hypothetical protein
MVSRHLSGSLVSYTGPVPSNLDILNNAFPNLKYLEVTRIESQDQEGVQCIGSIPHDVIKHRGVILTNDFKYLSSLNLRYSRPLKCPCYVFNCCQSHVEFTWEQHDFDHHDFTNKINQILKLLEVYVVKEDNHHQMSYSESFSEARRKKSPYYYKLIQQSLPKRVKEL